MIRFFRTLAGLRYSSRVSTVVLLFFWVQALPLFARYQWPLPTKQIVLGFLAGRTLVGGAAAEALLPSLGYWFEIDKKEGNQSKGIGQPHDTGEIIYYETSSDMDILGSIPRNIDYTIVVLSGKLLFRYSSDKLQIRLQDAYEVGGEKGLFNLPEEPKIVSRAKQAEQKPRLYIEAFDTEFQTVIDPALILSSIQEPLQNSRAYIEKVIASDTTAIGGVSGNLSTVQRPLGRSDQLLRGIYNLSFLFPQNQGLPLELHVSIDGKMIYSEKFDQVYGINSKLIINDRDLQDIYISDGRESKFFLGTINLQNKVNNLARLTVDEEYIDSSHSVTNYNIGIR